MRRLVDNSRTRRIAALVALSWTVCAATRGEEPITFVMPVANFQPVAADAYPNTSIAPTPVDRLEAVSRESAESAELVVPGESLECPNCHHDNDNCGCLPPGRLPNGQYPDDWMWGCGQWPYANGPGACDDWKVGPIWDVTVDGMVMTREHTDLAALETAMAEPVDPQSIEQFDRAAGGRVYLTGLVPRDVGYQVMAGYEGLEEWDASIVYPQEPPFPPFGTPTEQRALYYTSSLHSGELNILRTRSTAWRPYCGVRYIRFDDAIWDKTEQTALPPLPANPPETVNLENSLSVFDQENNLIGFQGGVKYDLWQFNRRFSLQGFANGGVYYNRAKLSNLSSSAQIQYIGDDSSLAGDQSTASGTSASSLTVIEESNIAYVGEASLTAVCRLNRCWACRAGYQVLYIDGLHLASDAYLGTGVDERSLIFHGWHAGIECRR